MAQWFIKILVGNGDGQRADCLGVDLANSVVPTRTDGEGTESVDEVHLTKDGEETQFWELRWRRAIRLLLLLLWSQFRLACHTVNRKGV